MSKLYDISQAIRPGIPVWPGDTEFGLTHTWRLEGDCPVNVSRLTLSTHTGTHADAPLHYSNEGVDSASCDLVPYLGIVQVIDLSSANTAKISADLVTGRIEKGTRRVILKLFPGFPHDRWPTGFPAIDQGVIAYLASLGVLLIGTDTPSLDPETSKTMDAHKAVERAGMAILEGLVLDTVPEGRYELIALPLKIEGADASPVRAVLRDLRSQAVNS